MGINSIDDPPDWVAFSCFTAISLGTTSGGWKIVKTMGTKTTKVTPLEGVIAETAGAFTHYLTEYLKIPVSTTHTITGAIIGVGATKRLSAVRWGVTKSLMTACADYPRQCFAGSRDLLYRIPFLLKCCRIKNRRVRFILHEVCTIFAA